MSSEEDGSEEDCCEYDDDYGYDDYYCDTCDREFDSADRYQSHISEHTVCGLDGCKFTAHEKIVQKHIEMQHKTGLYDKIRQFQSPEDVGKWIEERKKNYPNKENIELRRKKQEEMMKRGEILGQNKSRFGRRNETRAALPPRNKFGKGQKFPPNQKKKRNQKKVVKTKFKFDDKSDWNGNLPPFRGTVELFDDDDSDEISDDEDAWQTSESVQETSSMKKNKRSNRDSCIKLNNALGALMGAYNSSDYSEDDEEKEPEAKLIVLPTNTEAEEKEKPMEDEDDEAPEEVKTTVHRKEDDNVNSPAEEPAVIVVRKETPSPTVTGTKRKRKHIKKKFPRGNSKHKLPGKGPENGVAPAKKRDAGKVFQTNFKRRRVTLLEKLLEKDITHERNVILQCIRYIVGKKFFDTSTKIMNVTPDAVFIPPICDACPESLSSANENDL